MADYEIPTCIRCDDAVARTVERSRMPELPAPAALVVTKAKPRRPKATTAKCGTHSAFNLHRKHGQIVDAKCAAAERDYQRDRKRISRARAARERTAA
jgi:hypothetical protein